MDAVIYGVIDIAKMESLEKAPPDIILISPAIPLPALAMYSDNAMVSTPGTVIKQPKRKITISNKVYNNFFLTSGVFKAFFIVLNN